MSKIDFTKREKKILKIVEKFNESDTFLSWTKKYEKLLIFVFVIGWGAYFIYLVQGNVLISKKIFAWAWVASLFLFLNYFSDNISVTKKLLIRINELEGIPESTELKKEKPKKKGNPFLIFFVLLFSLVFGRIYFTVFKPENVRLKCNREANQTYVSWGKQKFPDMSENEFKAYQDNMQIQRNKMVKECLSKNGY